MNKIIHNIGKRQLNPNEISQLTQSLFKKTLFGCIKITPPEQNFQNHIFVEIFYTTPFGFTEKDLIYNNKGRLIKKIILHEGKFPKIITYLPEHLFGKRIL